MFLDFLFAVVLIQGVASNIAPHGKEFKELGYPTAEVI